MSKLWRINSNHGEISVRIIARELRGIFASVRQVDTDDTCVMNDMAVGQNESVRRDDGAGAIATEFACSAATANALRNIDVDHGRGYACDCAHDCARIGIEQAGVIRLRLLAKRL